jgi:hypothetical protein
VSDDEALAEGATGTLAVVPLGEPPAPQPNEPNEPNEPTVKDQLMRTFSAVRTRLRGVATTEDVTHENLDGEDFDDEDFDDLPAESAANGDRAGNGDGGHDAGDAHGNGSRAAPPADPLLADPPSNGSYPGDEAAPEHGRDAGPDPWLGVAANEALVEAPPDPEIDTEVVPLPAPVAGRGDATAPARPAARRRSRPALPILRRRPRVRKVTRIVRRVDAWGIFKISLIFYVILYIILLVAGVLLWNLANTTGTVANVEGFIRDLFGLKTFEFDGEKLFRASWVLGAVLVVAGTGLNVTLAILFNLISDLVGGVRVTVLEEEVVLRQRPVLPREMAPPRDADDDGTLTEPLPAPPPEPVVAPVVDAGADPYEPAPVYEPTYEPVYEPAGADDPAEALDATDPLLAETPRRARAVSRRSQGGAPPGNGTDEGQVDDDVAAPAEQAPPWQEGG